MLLAIATGFAGGFWFEERSAVPSPLRDLINRDLGKPDAVDFGLFWQVYNSLHENYVESGKINTQELLYGAISGMVNSVGDPYTVFFEPELSKKFDEEIAGSFGGVGMEIGKRNDIITVIAPLKNTPAFRAGILAGDRILKIGDKITAGLTVEEAVNLIRGPRGTKVTLTMSRNGENRVVELIRETIRVPAVEWKLLEGRIAYMEIFSFNQNVDDEFRKAAQEILKSKADRIIIDLRNNPGGLLDASVYLAGWFLDKGALVTVEAFGDGNKTEFLADGNGLLKGYRTVILQNGGSASASEILAGALHDNRGIIIIGEKSFGKGSVQELEKFFDGSSLKVTVAKWLTPNGISISDTGVEADIEVKIPEEDIASGSIELGTPGKDPQLDKAVEVVNGL